jgi:Xaa-Pro dipeptidase
MSKHDFTEAEFADRRARTQAALSADGYDCLIAIHPVSTRWLIGQDVKNYTGFQCLLVSTRNDALTVLTREMDRAEYEADTLATELVTYNGAEPEDPMEAFARFVEARGLRNRRVGLEVPGFYLSAAHYLKIKEILGDALVGEPTGLINSLKLVKSPQEIAYHRRSAAIAAGALEALIAKVTEGVTELELSGAAYAAILSAGSALPASTMNLMTGERSCFPLGQPTERAMKRGDTGLVELGGAYRRYTSTLGRQWVLGEPGARLRELFDIVRAASAACMARMRDGAPAIDGHEALKSTFVDAGVDGHRQHTSGYGMAPAFPPAWGEPTNMFGGSTDVLKAGMVVSVEPGLFLKEEGLGVRLIDNCLITNDGVEVLSTTPQELIIVA